MSVDNLSQRSYLNEIAYQLNFREHSADSVDVDNNIFTKAWVNSAGCEGIKDDLGAVPWHIKHDSLDFLPENKAACRMEKTTTSKA